MGKQTGEINWETKLESQRNSVAHIGAPYCGSVYILFCCLSLQNYMLVEVFTALNRTDEVIKSHALLHIPSGRKQ